MDIAYLIVTLIVFGSLIYTGSWWNLARTDQEECLKRKEQNPRFRRFTDEHFLGRVKRRFRFSLFLSIAYAIDFIIRLV